MDESDNKKIFDQLLHVLNDCFIMVTIRIYPKCNTFISSISSDELIEFWTNSV